MRKRLLLFTMIMLSFGMIGCTNQKTNTTNETVETTPIETEVAEDVLPSNTLGLKDITVTDLKTKFEQNEGFYLYVYNNETEQPKEDVDAALSFLMGEYNVLSDFCYVDYSILTDREKDVLKEVIGDVTYGIFAIENMTIQHTFETYAQPEGDTSSTLSTRIVNFVYESNLFIDDHGHELVSYEQALEKIASGEKFILYVGRDTCRYCHEFDKSLSITLEEYPSMVPIYYLYTQSYKTAINNKEENAQETWDNLKASLAIEFTPSFLIYEDGQQVDAYQGYIESDYFTMTDEEKDTKIKEVADVLAHWFASNGLSGVCLEACD